MSVLNKRALPASLTFSGAIPFKKENCVTQGMGSLQLHNETLESSKRDPDSADTSDALHDEDTFETDLGLDGVEASATNVLKASNDDFKRVVTLGTGSFAKVILVVSLIPGDNEQLMAMKVLDKNLVIARKQTSHTMTERSVLGRCSSSHPFIVSLRYAFQTPETLNLVIDFCAGGELYYHLFRTGRFEESRAKFYAAELALALEHLHSFNVVYRDLKPENVLIASDGNIMLADFGLAKEGIRDVFKGTDTFCGTPEYLSPEILRRQGHGIAVDWWALGILLYEMIVGVPPWYSKNHHIMFDGICNKHLEFPNDCSASPAARNLIEGLLVKDPRRRIASLGASEVREHVFFQDIDFEALLAKEVTPPWIPEKNKIYFDAEYTQLPCDTPGGTMTARPPQPPVNTAVQGDDSLLATGNLMAASPMLASSYVERAFTGFSYTNPSLNPPTTSRQETNPPSPTKRSPTPTVRASTNSLASLGSSNSLEYGADLHDLPSDDDEGQFSLELDE
eukprot:CAMPEP_0184515160 /NCGR_PEP_ID=MMETSP0198_2-20121128/4349_1 /TAXON_ID=1112570 /ORGANISM="Thraustochytrium sp., Strain LLF1b" /LENGTH=507 /DNA_ID=CAMNT_0026905399 /DNA_START=1103 /DNA_END=2626 /DNA_ORIENTATION=-